MSGREIMVAAPVVRWCSPAEVIELAGGAGSIVVGIYVGIAGSLSGHALLLLPPAGARRLAHLLLDGVVADDYATSAGLVFDPLEVSALQEVGNVTISAFLNELGMHLHEPVVPTVPQLVVEMAGSILESVLADLLLETDEVVAAETTFIDGVDTVEGAFLVLPRQASLPIIVDALGASGQ
jgi:chemotaxis protein CheC